MGTATYKFYERPALLFWLLAAAWTAFALNGCLFYLANDYAVSPFGHGGWLVLTVATMVIGVPLFLALLAIPIGLVALFIRSLRRPAGVILLCGLIYALVGFPAFWPGYWARMSGFERVAANEGAELVSAIKAFRAEYGHPPETLEELTPEFLPELPGTGMPAYPQWEYVTGEAAQEFDRNPWAVYMWCSRGFLNFDRFMHLPLRNYPTKGYGGAIKRVGDWAYVHE